MEDMDPITEELREIHTQQMNGTVVPKVRKQSHGSSSRPIPPYVEDDTVIGFDQGLEVLKDKLTGLSKKLEVISIVGMAGLGKTTLARKLYNDPLIVYHFYIRGWTYVSQVYQKGDLLRRILSSLVPQKDDIRSTSEEKLGEKLYRRLKGNRYFIVIDDIWNIAVWEDIRKSFPNDNKGSRILFTTRMKEVAFRAEPDEPPHFLKFLTFDESWLLLQQKVFMGESCPQDLIETGKRIAENCHGLPLTIVVVAGILAKTEKKQQWWKEVAASVSSYVFGNTEQCMSTLNLSYNHLPQYLKPCFLYLGAFPEDYEIPVRKLIWLWVAEGFIKQNGNKSLEDVAEEYLLELVDRSLVLIAKTKSTGEIRACRVHDLLHDLCLRKANEEKFLVCDLSLKNAKEEMDLQHNDDNDEILFPQVPRRYRKDCQCFYSCFRKLSRCLGFRKVIKENSLLQNHEVELVSASSWIPKSSDQKRLSVHSRVFDFHSLKPFASHIHSLLCFISKHSPSAREKLPSMFHEFQLLKVLDLSTIRLPTFPNKVVQLPLLRYLALRGKYLSPPASISTLCNLETLVLSESTGIYICREIWKMVSLRHLCIAGKNHVLKFSDEGYPSVLDNLRTLSYVSPSRECQAVLAKTPLLRKLGFCGNLISKGKFWFPDIVFLNHLESLKLFNVTSSVYNLSYWDIRLKVCCRKGVVGCNIHPSRLEVKFPQNLKRLTLSGTYLEWQEMSVVGMLPNLVALKLEFLACYGPRWETSPGGFRQLKYLRLKCMDIEEWDSSRSHFPILRSLVLHGCEKLEEIPFEFGDIPTLETIDISWCSYSTVVSARQILEEQQSNGNELLRVFFNPPDRNFGTDT